VLVPGLSHWDKPLGQAQPVPVGQADWDLCLSQWDKHSLSQLGLGKVKIDLSLSHGTGHIPTLEAFPCPGTSSIPTMELVPVPLVPTCPTKRVYKDVEFCKEDGQNPTFDPLPCNENCAVICTASLLYEIGYPFRSTVYVPMEF